MNKIEIATLGGGCFWCVESIYESVLGVEEVYSGYAGGKTENPTYEEVKLLNQSNIEELSCCGSVL